MRDVLTIVIRGVHNKDMNNDTYTAQELRDLIESARNHTREAERLGLRWFAQICRRDRRELEAKLEALVNA